MQRRKFTSVLCLLRAVPGDWPRPRPKRPGLTEIDAASGVRAALERGASPAVGLLGKTDGFLGNPKVRIPLPGFLNDAAKLLEGHRPAKARRSSSSRR